MSATPGPTAVGDAGHDPDEGPRRTTMAMVAVMVLFLAAAFAWSLIAELDVAVDARGSVVRPSRIQEVQSLEGGIVQDLLVRAGQAVKKGQLLARLDAAPVHVDLGASRQQSLVALAGRARVEALLSGSAPRFEDAWRREAPELVMKETQLWRDALREFQANSRVAREAIQRKRAELAEAQARIGQLQSALKVGEENFAIEERLLKAGAGARADYLIAQQRLLGQKSALDALKQSLPRLLAGLATAEAAAAEADAKARAQWRAQRSDYETQVGALGGTLSGREERVARRDVVSPVDGVVNRVLVTTLGSVVAPGKPVIEVVPDEPELLMILRVKPTDIGFIRVGQPARVRVLAYDAATFGKVQASASRVGVDAVVDEKGEAYFEVQLKAARDQLKQHDKPLAIAPGMLIDASVLTGRRSVMQVLLQPVLRLAQGAMRER